MLKEFSGLALGFPFVREQLIPKQALVPSSACSLSGQIVIHDTLDPLLLGAHTLGLLGAPQGQSPYVDIRGHKGHHSGQV